MHTCTPLPSPHAFWMGRRAETDFKEAHPPGPSGTKVSQFLLLVGRTQQEEVKYHCMSQSSFGPSEEEMSEKVSEQKAETVTK